MKPRQTSGPLSKSTVSVFWPGLMSPPRSRRAMFLSDDLEHLRIDGKEPPELDE
jgi:hypothetical protein